MLFMDPLESNGASHSILLDEMDTIEYARRYVSLESTDYCKILVQPVYLPGFRQATTPPSFV